MVSKNLQADKSMIKSIETNDHGWFEIDNNSKSPYGQCCKFFDLE